MASATAKFYVTYALAHLVGAALVLASVAAAARPKAPKRPVRMPNTSITTARLRGIRTSCVGPAIAMVNSTRAVTSR
ncbi:hypothetical protein H7I01_16035, partial [Mycobacterium palustre]|nr:hypothetical protein [Mycobacterium palustre]